MFSFPATLMSGTSASTGIIQSIQRVEITIATGSTSNTATISSVNTANTVLLWNGWRTNNSGGGISAQNIPRMELTNSTTVTVSRNTSSATDTVTLCATVIEFASSAISRIQTGTITVASGSTTASATLANSVDTSRSCVFYYGNTATNNSNYSLTSDVPTIELASSTSVTATRGTSGNDLTVGYAVVEFATGIINSVQQRVVTMTTSATATTDTISSVNTGRTLLIYNGWRSGATTSTPNTAYRMELAGATSVTLTRTGISTASRTVSYTVLEFAAGIVNTLQRGTTVMNSVTSNTSTISSVNMSKSILNWNFNNSDAPQQGSRWQTGKLTNATTVSVDRGVASTVNATAAWEIAEFV